MRQAAALFLLTFCTTASAQQADDPLEKARAASLSLANNILSARGQAIYEDFSHDGEAAPVNSQVKAKVKVLYDSGKYHLTFAYEMNLRRTTLINAKGEDMKVFAGDSKTNELHVLYDGMTGYLVTIYKHVNPVRATVEKYPRFPREHFPFHDPARLAYSMANVDGAINNLGRDAITVEKLPGGTYRAKTLLKNSAVRWELDFDPKVDFNVVATRVFNRA